MLKKKNLCQFSKNFRTLYPKNCHWALKNMGFGSETRAGIRKKPIPDPGSRGQKGTGSRIRIRNTGFTNAFKVNSWQNLLDFLLNYFMLGLDRTCFGGLTCYHRSIFHLPQFLAQYIIHKCIIAIAIVSSEGLAWKWNQWIDYKFKYTRSRFSFKNNNIFMLNYWKNYP